MNEWTSPSSLRHAHTSICSNASWQQKDHLTGHLHKAEKIPIIAQLQHWMLCFLSFGQVHENSAVLKPNEESLISVSPEDTSTQHFKSRVIIDIYRRDAVWWAWRCCLSIYIIKCPKGADEQHQCSVRKASLQNNQTRSLSCTQIDQQSLYCTERIIYQNINSHHLCNPSKAERLFFNPWNTESTQNHAKRLWRRERFSADWEKHN